MRKKIVVLLLFFFIIFCYSSTCFANYDEVTVQQDVSSLALRDIQTVRDIIANNDSLHNSLLSSPSTDLCYAIKPSATSTNSNLNLYVYRKSFITGATSDDNYYGILTPGFYINEYILYSISRGSFTRNYITNVNAWLPSFYYFRSIVELTEGLEDNSSVVSSIDENTNAIKENTEVNKDTKDFLTSDNEVDDSTVEDFQNSVGIDMSSDDKGNDFLSSLFSLFDEDRAYKRNFSFTFSVPFSSDNLSITLTSRSTRDFIVNSFGLSVYNVLSSVIQFIYCFLVLKFIVGNSRKLIDKISTGNVDKINTDNILVDVF